MSMRFSMAPELQALQWFNIKTPLSLVELRGKVVVIEAFQMLCPGCVSHGLPQAQGIAETFSPDDVVVLGLHSVFEHHEAMQPHALEVFLHEYDVRFPIAVDAPSDAGSGPVPKTMAAYDLRGTPSLLVIDRLGRLRIKHFGVVRDMRIAAAISGIVVEANGGGKQEFGAIADLASGCTADGCTI